MQWLRSHPYAVSIAVAIVLILLGALVIRQRVTVAPDDSATRVWGGIGTRLFDTTSSASNSFGNNQENIYSEVTSGPPFYYDPTPVQTPSANVNWEDNFDFNAFFAMLSGPHTSASFANDDSLLETAYSFIPGGLISTSSSQKERTPAQQALYNYGNEAGSFIQSFENSFRNASQILKDQSADRENPAKNAILERLAEGLGEVGMVLENMGEVPDAAASAHAKVAASYRELGEKLARIPAARREEEFIAATLTYNGAVETYVKNYVALATLLSAYGIKFTPEDPGSVFTFTQAGF